MIGHIVDKCHKKHGYPLGFKFKNKLPPSSSKLNATAQESTQGFTPIYSGFQDVNAAQKFTFTKEGCDIL